MAVSAEGKAAVLMYFVKRSPILRMYQFLKFVTGKGPIQSAAITSQKRQWGAKVVLSGEHPVSSRHRKRRI